MNRKEVDKEILALSHYMRSIMKFPVFFNIGDDQRLSVHNYIGYVIKNELIKKNLIDDFIKQKMDEDFFYFRAASFDLVNKNIEVKIDYNTIILIENPSDNLIILVFRKLEDYVKSYLKEEVLKEMVNSKYDYIFKSQKKLFLEKIEK